MATQSISPIAEIAPVRTPDRAKHPAPGREKFVVPGPSDAPRRAQEPRREAANANETGVADIRPPDDRRNALRRAEGERTAPATAGESGGANPPGEAAASGGDPTAAGGATAAQAAPTNNAAQAALTNDAAHAALPHQTAHAAPPEQTGIPAGRSSADDSGIEDPAAGATARPATSAAAGAGADGVQADGVQVASVQAAGGAGKQPDAQGPAEAAPDDLPARLNNPAVASSSATPAPDVSAAAGTGSIPVAPTIAAMAGAARDTGRTGSDDNPDAGPSDARGIKAAGTGSVAPGGSPGPSGASANGSEASAGGNAPGAAQTPSGAAAGGGAPSAAQVVANAQPAAADAMQRAAAAPPPGDGTVAPSFQAEMRAALDASAQAAAATARGAVTAQPAADQVALQISRAVERGSDRLTVHLRPAELGKVTIELEVGPDRRVTAVISAERSETLDLLQRDARSLERALNDAGLRTGAGSLEFGLQGNGDQTMRRDGGDRTDGTMSVPDAGNGERDGEAAAVYGPRIVPDGRVNIQV